MNPSVDLRFFKCTLPQFTINLSKLARSNTGTLETSLANTSELYCTNSKCHVVSTRCNIAHRDLKPQNLLVKRYRTDNVQIKLADFGISRRGRDTGMTLFAGTTAFIPIRNFADPEAMFGGPGLDPEFRLKRLEKSKRKQEGITLTVP